MFLFLLVYYIYFIYRSMESLHMLQQNLYNENNRYLKWLRKNKSRVFNSLDFMPILFFSVIYFVKDQGIIDFALVAGLLVYMYCFYIEYRKNKESQNKVPLKVTSRIKRLFVTLCIIYTVIVVVLLKINNNIILASTLIFAVLMVAFVYYVLYLALIINTPIDKMEIHYYLKKLKIN